MALRGTVPVTSELVTAGAVAAGVAVAAGSDDPQPVFHDNATTITAVGMRTRTEC
jgi:hypothetical protein